MEDNDVKQVVEKLLNNTYSKGDVKQLKGLKQIYRIKTNRKGRILFKVDNGRLILLNYLANHEYDKSSFLKRGVLKNFLENYGDELEWKSLEEDEHLSLNNNHEAEITYRPVDYYKSNFIVLNGEQNSAVEASLPAIVNGPAGSGKTSVALIAACNYIRESDGQVKVLFICPDNLVDVMQKQWQEQPLPYQFPDAITFKSYRTLILEQKPNLKTLKEIKQEEVNAWFKKNIANYNIGIKDLFQIHEEFQIFSIYSKEEYLSLGQKQCWVYGETEKGELVIFFTEYMKWLVNNKKYDLHFELMEEKERYHSIFVDEAANLSFLALTQLSSLTKEKKVAYFLDPNQDLTGEMSKRIHLENKLPSSTLSVDLPTVFRSAKKIVECAMRWLNIKHALTRGVDHKSDYRTLEAAPDKETGAVYWEKERNFDQVYQDVLRNYSPEEVAIVRNNSSAIPGVKKIYQYTPEEAQGWEFLVVIIYDLFSSKVYRQVDAQLQNVEENELSKNQNRKKSAQDLNIPPSTVPELNRTFTALTRAEETLVICQKISNIGNIYRLFPSDAKNPLPSKEGYIKEEIEEGLMRLARKCLEAGDKKRFYAVCQEMKKDPIDIRKKFGYIVEEEIKTAPKRKKKKKKGKASASRSSHASTSLNTSPHVTDSTIKKAQEAPPAKELNTSRIKQNKVRQPLDFSDRMVDDATGSSGIIVNNSRIDDVDDLGRGQLHGACEYRNEWLFNLAIDSENVNIKDKQGETSISLLFKNDEPIPMQFVKKLIARGANLNFTHADGETILTRALLKKSFDVAKLLLENGAEPQ